MGRCYIWTAGAAVAGARLLYVLTNLDRFDNFLDIFKVWQGGLVAYGGFLGGFVGACGLLQGQRHPAARVGRLRGAVACAPAS